MSKVTSIMSEDLTFKIDDLFNLKDMQRIVSTKDELIEHLSQFSEFLKIDTNTGICKFQISEALIIYNFINFQNKSTKEQLIGLLGIEEKDILRFYKQSLYWTLVVESEDIANKIDEIVKTVKLEDDKPMRFEKNNGKTIIKQILKKIQCHHYAKDTNELKGSNNNSDFGKSIRKDSYNKSTNQNSDNFSWRKKSDVSENEYNLIIKKIKLPTY
jgi:hypothetical protein